MGLDGEADVVDVGLVDFPIVARREEDPRKVPGRKIHFQNRYFHLLKAELHIELNLGFPFVENVFGHPIDAFVVGEKASSVLL